MLDLLFVGAGLTTATIVSALRDRGLRMQVVECRPHIAGNCYDYACGGHYVSLYGRHILHSFNTGVLDYLGKFAPLEDSGYVLHAEIEWQGRLHVVPVPFQPAVAEILGAELTDAEILDCYFRGYSFKQWGVPWDALPDSIRGRVPPRGDFFKQKPRLFPRGGYTAMIERMLGDVPVLLNAHPDYWREIPARRVVYCGRADLLAAQRLDYRVMRYEWRLGGHATAAHGLNYCHPHTPFVRSMTYGPYVCFEHAVDAPADDPSPSYPFPTTENLAHYAAIRREVEDRYPNLLLAGRLGDYRYYDMDMAVAAGLKLAQRLRNEL